MAALEKAEKEVMKRAARIAALEAQVVCGREGHRDMGKEG